MSKKDKFERLAKMREEAKLGGGEERIEKQHEKGKYTAMERIEIGTSASRPERMRLG